MIRLGADELEQRVRRKIEDRSSIAFTAAEVLEALDEALETIYTDLSNLFEDYEGAAIEITPSQLTTVSSLVADYVLPEWVTRVRHIEGERSTEVSSLYSIDEFPKVEKEVRNQVAGPPVWHWVDSRPGTVRIRGRTTNYTRIRLWVERRWPPLHYGTAQGGTSTTIDFATDANATGKVLQRADLYTGIDVVVTNDLPVGAKDQLRRISSYAGGASRTATVRDAWSVVPDSSTTYALVAPVPEELQSLLVMEAALILAEEMGEQAQVGLIMPRLERLRAKALDAAATRDFRPKRIWNHGW